MRPLVIQRTSQPVPVRRVGSVTTPTKRTVIVSLHRRPVAGVSSLRSAGGGGGGGEEPQDQWQTEDFRHSLVWKLEELIRNSGKSIERNAVELEREVFRRANTKEEYLGDMARLIFHINGLDNEVKKLEDLTRDSGTSTETEVFSSNFNLASSIRI